MFDTAVEISEDILDKMVTSIKLAVLVLVIAISHSSGSPVPGELYKKYLTNKSFVGTYL